MGAGGCIVEAGGEGVAVEFRVDGVEEARGIDGEWDGLCVGESRQKPRQRGSSHEAMVNACMGICKGVPLFFHL